MYGWSCEYFFHYFVMLNRCIRRTMQPSNGTAEDNVEVFTLIFIEWKRAGERGVHRMCAHVRHGYANLRVMCIYTGVSQHL